MMDEEKSKVFKANKFGVDNSKDLEAKISTMDAQELKDFSVEVGARVGNTDAEMRMNIKREFAKTEGIRKMHAMPTPIIPKVDLSNPKFKRVFRIK